MENIVENFIDVRVIEPINKHKRIFERFDALSAGESLLIINDHDPKPLYYQLLAERGNVFEWLYIENGPVEWRVNITLRIDNAEETVGQIAAKDIKKVEIFRKYGIDFCCGGKKSLAKVCEEKGLELSKVEAELNSANDMAPHAHTNFNDFPLDFLCEYIVNAHHSYAKKTLPILVELGEKVANKHGGRNPELIKIANLINLINTELTLHMRKEEVVLFPFIHQLVSKTDFDKTKGLIKEPITLMEMEHESVGSYLEEIELFTNDFTPPANACNSYQLLYYTLKQFNEDIHLHVHLENNILFPKALDLIK